MSVFLSWPALVFFGWLAGYIAVVAVTPSVWRKEGFNLQPAGIALYAFLVMAWPVFFAWVIADRVKSRD